MPALDDPVRPAARLTRVSTWSAPVRWSEVDPQGIVFNAHYLTYCDETMAVFCAQRGLGPFAEQVHVVGATLSWTAPLRQGDLVEVTARCTAVGNTSLTMTFDIVAGGRECCAAQLTYVYTGAGSGPTPVPPDVRTALS